MFEKWLTFPFDSSKIYLALRMANGIFFIGDEGS